MTLLITVFAAVISTVVWYTRKNDDLKISMLALMYWGASIMWFIDAIYEYAELHAEYFVPAAQDMVNDAFLGFAVVALGLIIWLIRLLIADPEGKLRATLKKSLR